VEENEKDFHKAIRQVGFFDKDLDLGLFDPFKDMRDVVLLDKKDIVAKKEDAVEEQDVRASVQAFVSLFSSLLDFGLIGYVIMMIFLLLIMHLLSFVDECCLVCMSCMFLLSMQCSVTCGSKDKPP